MRVMLPDDANPAGNVHGGTILKLMEEGTQLDVDERGMAEVRLRVEDVLTPRDRHLDERDQRLGLLDGVLRLDLLG